MTYTVPCSDCAAEVPVSRALFDAWTANPHRVVCVVCKTRELAALRSMGVEVE